MTTPFERAWDSDIPLLKSLADETRLRLLRLLLREELNVQELAHILKMAQPRVSRHLAVLRNAGLVRDRRQGTKVFYTSTPWREDMSLFVPYLESLGGSQHPDLERLEECLRSRTQEARCFADLKAEQWDEIGKLLHSSSASLLALTTLTPGRFVVADLGTGTGILLPFLSVLAGRVYAVDQSARMLAKARIRCKQLGLGNVVFIQSGIEDLERQLPPCDGLLLHFVLHQIARPQAILKTTCAYLKPGGKLVIVDRVQHHDEKAKTTFGSLWLGFARSQIQQWAVQARLNEFAWHELAGTGRGAEPNFDIFVAAMARSKETTS